MYQKQKTTMAWHWCLTWSKFCISSWTPPHCWHPWCTLAGPPTIGYPGRRSLPWPVIVWILLCVVKTVFHDGNLMEFCSLDWFPVSSFCFGELLAASCLSWWCLSWWSRSCSTGPQRHWNMTTTLFSSILTVCSTISGTSMIKIKNARCLGFSP